MRDRDGPCDSRRFETLLHLDLHEFLSASKLYGYPWSGVQESV